MDNAEEALRQIRLQLDPDAAAVLPQRGPLSVAPAILIITQRYASELTVAELAHAVHMSRFHFIRVFHRETGMTPHRLLMRYRVVRAMAMLKEGDLGVGRIGQEVGYLNAAAFSRAFLDLVGVPPQVYRTLARDRRTPLLPVHMTPTPPPQGQAEASSLISRAAAV